MRANNFSSCFHTAAAAAAVAAAAAAAAAVAAVAAAVAAALPDVKIDGITRVQEDIVAELLCTSDPFVENYHHSFMLMWNNFFHPKLAFALSD